MYSLSRVVRALRWLLTGNAAQRRRVRREFARIAAGLFGDFPISDDYKLWREDRTFMERYYQLSPGNPYSQDRKFVLRELVRFTRNVPGMLAECGTYQGASAYFMACEAPTVPLYLFDSFEGLSAPSLIDRPLAVDHLLWQVGDMRATEDTVRRTLAEFDNVRFFKGWIPERFPEVATERFRLLHLDVDLYQPTLDSLEFFYPRLSQGGTIIMDDYGSTLCPGAYQAATEFMSDKAEYVIHLPTGQGIVIKMGDLG